MEPVVILVAVVAGAVVGVILSYNRFVAQRAGIDASWAKIDVELQRRHDLVPNLVEAVHGYAAHEERTLAAVTEARSRAVAATSEEVDLPDQARAEDALTEGLSRLFAVSEELPDLKADRAFRDLQRQLVETEDRIAAARRLYNLEVAAYERRRRAVPSNLVAWIFSLPPRRLFEIRDPAQAHAVHVAW